MFLIDVVEFNVSRFLPKTTGNKRARKIAADLLRDGRRYERTVRSKIASGKNIIHPKLDTLHTVTLSALNKNNFKTNNLRPTDLPDYTKLKTGTIDKKGNVRPYNLLEKNKLSRLGETQKKLLDGNTPDYQGKLSTRKYGTREYNWDKLSPKSKTKYEESNRVNQLLNDTWEDVDYRKAIGAIYNNHNNPVKKVKMKKTTEKGKTLKELLYPNQGE